MVKKKKMHTETTAPEQSDELQHLLAKLKQETLEKTLLLEVSKNLNSTLNLQKVLDLFLESLSPVVPYDAVGIFLVDRNTNKLLPEFIHGYDHEALKQAHLKVGKGLTGLVAIEGKGFICPDVSNEPRYINARKETRSAVVVPLIVKERLLGVLSLESNALYAFDEHSFSLLTAFANHAAIAIDNARLHKEVLRSQELRHDLKTARRIQKALLPKSLPRVDGYDFATISIPSKTVSGDFYDSVRMASGKVAIAIGDVSGKGTPAAILMASIYSSYKSLLYEPLAVSDKIFGLNNVLGDSNLIGNYATFFYGELQPEKRELVYCNAGHFPPLVIRRNGSVEDLKTGGTVLGFISDAPFQQESVSLNSGDVLFLYTDGLVEAQNPQMEFYDLGWAVQLVRDHVNEPAAAIKDAVLASVVDFTQSDRHEDDLTLIVIKVA